MKPSFAHYDIHAYIDGELSELEAKEFENEIKTNPALEREVCMLRRNKQSIANFYRQIDVPEMNFSLDKPKSTTGTRWPSLAASIMLGMVIGAGILSAYVDYQPKLGAQAIAQTPIASDKFMVHIDSDEPAKVTKTLAEAQYILESNPHAEVEIIANHQGIQLFDANNADISQIKAMLAKYDNLRLVACQRALERARESDKNLHILPQVKADAPAIDEVVEKLKQGWTYIKI